MAPGSFKKRRRSLAPGARGGAAELVALRARHERLEARFALICQATSDGLWDMEPNCDKLFDPANPCWWSDQLRRLRGFEGAASRPRCARRRRSRGWRATNSW